VVEVIMQMAVYAGFPAALNGLKVLMKGAKRKTGSSINGTVFSHRLYLPLAF
jgi:hypothetical protein